MNVNSSSNINIFLINQHSPQMYYYNELCNKRYTAAKLLVDLNLLIQIMIFLIHQHYQSLSHLLNDYYKKATKDKV